MVGEFRVKPENRHLIYEMDLNDPSRRKGSQIDVVALGSRARKAG